MRGRVEVVFRNFIFPDRVDGVPCMIVELACVKWASHYPFQYMAIYFYVAVGPDGSVRQLTNIWYIPKDERTIEFCRSLFEFINRGDGRNERKADELGYALYERWRAKRAP